MQLVSINRWTTQLIVRIVQRANIKMLQAPTAVLSALRALSHLMVATRNAVRVLLVDIRMKQTPKYARTALLGNTKPLKVLPVAIAVLLVGTRVHRPLSSHAYSVQWENSKVPSVKPVAQTVLQANTKTPKALLTALAVVLVGTRATRQTNLNVLFVWRANRKTQLVKRAAKIVLSGFRKVQWARRHVMSVRLVNTRLQWEVCHAWIISVLQGHTTLASVRIVLLVSISL